ncbi:hypothetical protein IT415_03225 [bacterium]|nr:hypothetical protein [bacterium]
MNDSMIMELPEPQRSSVIAALQESVLLALAEELEDILPPHDKVVFEEILAKDTSQATVQLQDFLSSKVPDLSTRIERIQNEKIQNLHAGVLAVRTSLKNTPQ